MKKVLVTGAAGFIGSHVSEALLSRRQMVVALDDLNDYYSPERKRKNVREVRRSVKDVCRFEFVHGDVRDRALLRHLFEQHEFDAVVHLAAMAGIGNSMQAPHLYCDVNITGTLNILEAASVHRTEQLILASTSSVYGATKCIPFVETDPCDRPLAPYPASKRAAEMLAYTYHYLYGQQTTVLRFFTVYGPRGRPDMMAYKVLDNIFHGRDVPLYNGGQMYRDWTYVDDIVSGILAALDRPLGYEIINLGCGEPVLLGDFVRLLEGLAGRRANLTVQPKPIADIDYTYADITKARTLLGYEPQTSVQEGVARFWAWYRHEVLRA